VGEKLRRLIAETPIATTAGSLSVTVSSGVSGLEALSANESVTVDGLLDRADECLYVSKQQGRNRVTVAEKRSA
jgi:PleD family two-component response regulator